MLGKRAFSIVHRIEPADDVGPKVPTPAAGCATTMRQMPCLALLAICSLLQAVPASAARPASLTTDVARVAASVSNEGRFEAITALLRERNLTFTVEPFTLEKPLGREPRTEGRNIVVTLGDGAEDVVLGAHYDAARLADGSLSRGAVDNAASSVILVRVAEALRAERWPVRLRVVWFDMEELGLIGSARYIERHAADRIVAMLNFDINAYGDTILFGPSEHAGNKELRRMLVVTCAAEDVPCIGMPQMPPGDDRSFVKAGVPTLSIAVLPAVEAHQVWLLMNAGAAQPQAAAPPIFRIIHTAEDVVGKVNAQAMSMMFRIALSLARSVARR